LVDSAVSHRRLLEACDRASADHLRPAVLVACFSIGNVHRCNVCVCECYWDTVPADHSTYICLYGNVSLVHYLRWYAFQAWKLLSFLPLRFEEKHLKTVCFDLFILKQALKRTRSVCLRAFQPAMCALLFTARDFCGQARVFAIFHAFQPGQFSLLFTPPHVGLCLV
jgi:hypothetical protein